MNISMRTMLWKILFFLCTLNSLWSLDPEQFFCGKKFFCEQITCEKCPGDSLKNGSYCNCCDTCNYREDILWGQCQQDREKRRLLISESDDYVEDLWLPQCNSNGKYALKQQKGHVTFCMGDAGKKLFGRQFGNQNMTCKCSKEGKFSDLCTSSGDYEQVQCIGNLCYCAEHNIGQVEGRIVAREHIDKLFCFKKDKSYSKPCHEEFLKVKQVYSDFHKKGIDVVGIEEIRCDPDGTFSPSQCDANRCSCTDKNGIQIKSYYTDDSKLGQQMACECARANGNMQCDQFGNYKWSQCFHKNQCFCVDEEGEVISKKFTIAHTSLCLELWQRLKRTEFHAKD